MKPSFDGIDVTLWRPTFSRWTEERAGCKLDGVSPNMLTKLIVMAPANRVAGEDDDQGGVLK